MEFHRGESCWSGTCPEVSRLKKCYECYASLPNEGEDGRQHHGLSAPTLSIQLTVATQGASVVGRRFIFFITSVVSLGLCCTTQRAPTAPARTASAPMAHAATHLCSCSSFVDARYHTRKHGAHRVVKLLCAHHHRRHLREAHTTHGHEWRGWHVWAHTHHTTLSLHRVSSTALHTVYPLSMHQAL